MKNVIGVDYGSDSCRVVIINAENGDEIASSVKYYKRWKGNLQNVDNLYLSS